MSPLAEGGQGDLVAFLRALVLVLPLGIMERVYDVYKLSKLETECLVCKYTGLFISVLSVT